MSEGRIPSFVLIGGQRCGTSWIHSCLQEHPQVFTADPKEIHFFNRHFERGPNWYRSCFQFDGPFLAWGEVTPDYLSDPVVPERMYSLMPDVQILCCLRNPIERAYSAFELKHQSRYRSFEAALEAQPAILEMGRYGEHLERWMGCFAREQILVLLFDDLKRDDIAFTQRIYSYLGVDESFRSAWIGKTANTVVFPSLQTRLRSLKLGWTIAAAKRTPIGSAIRRGYRRSRRHGRPLPLNAATKSKLLEYYEPSLSRLERLIDRDLAAWRNV